MIEITHTNNKITIMTNDFRVVNLSCVWLTHF